MTALRACLLCALLSAGPAWAQVPKLVIVAPDHLVLGEQTQGPLELKVNGVLDPAGVRMRASVGTPADFTNAGKSVVGVFRTPETMSPQTAILGAVARIDGKPVVAWQTLPLYGVGDLPVTGAPGSSVTATIGPVLAGPVTLDRSGRGKVRIRVPPGYTQVIVGSRAMDLGEVPYKRILGVAIDDQVAADGFTTTALQVMVVDKFGKPDALAKVFFKADRGGVSPVRPVGLGLFAVTYTAPADVGNGVDAVECGIVGDDVSREKIPLKLVGGAPRKVRAWLEPASYVAGDPPPMMWVTIADAAGNPLDNAHLDFNVEAGKFGPPRRQSPGRYFVPFLPPDSFEGRSELKITAVATTPGGTPVTQEVTLGLKPGKPKRLRVDFDQESAVADGRTRLPITVKAVDAHGNHVPWANITATVDAGATEPPQKTDEGVVIHYHPPLAFEPVRAVVHLTTDGNVNADVPLDLLPAQNSWVIGLRGGYQSNLGSLRTPAVGLSIATRLRLLLPQLYVSLELGGLTGSRSWAIPDAGGPEVPVSLLVPTGGLHLRLRFDIGPLVGSIGGGPTAGVVLAAITPEGAPARSERLLVAGAEGSLGLGVRMGRVTLGVEGRYQHLPVQSTIVQGNAGGASGSVKLELEL